MDITSHLGDMGDAALIDATKEAVDDLNSAARDQPESEWHSACFAAVIVLSQEMSRPGLRINTVH